MNELIGGICWQILFIDIKVDGKEYAHKRANISGMEARFSKKEKKAKPLKLTMDYLPCFLEDYPTSKVITVITTHCIEDTGEFVCGGAIGACDLHQVHIPLTSFSSPPTSVQHSFFRCTSRQKCGCSCQQKRRRATVTGR